MRSLLRRDAGRTTVILQSATVGKRGKAASGAWGAATWGEQPDGKSWLRLNAYGLTVDQVRNAVERQNVEVPGGSFVTGPAEIALRTMGRIWGGRR